MNTPTPWHKMTPMSRSFRRLCCGYVSLVASFIALCQGDAAFARSACYGGKTFLTILHPSSRGAVSFVRDRTHAKFISMILYQGCFGMSSQSSARRRAQETGVFLEPTASCVTHCEAACYNALMGWGAFLTGRDSLRSLRQNADLADRRRGTPQRLGKTENGATPGRRKAILFPRRLARPPCGGLRPIPFPLRRRWPAARPSPPGLPFRSARTRARWRRLCRLRRV